nr:hypothetical protein [Candidatus Sigynarchaeum springense]
MALYTLDEPAGIEDPEVVAIKFTRDIPAGFNLASSIILVIDFILLALGVSISMLSFMGGTGIEYLRFNLSVVFGIFSVPFLTGVCIWLVPRLYPREVSIVASVGDRLLRVIKTPAIGHRAAIRLIDLSRVYAVRTRRWQYKTKTGIVNDFLLIFFLKNRPAWAMHFETGLINVVAGLERSLRAMVPGDGMENDERLFKGILGRMVAIQVAAVLATVGFLAVLSYSIGTSPFEHVKEIFVVDPLFQSIPIFLAIVAVVYSLSLKHRTPGKRFLLMLILMFSLLISAGFLLLVWSLRLAVLGMDASIVMSSSTLFWFQLHLLPMMIFSSILNMFRPFEMIGGLPQHVYW